MSSGLDEVISPDIVLLARPQPDTVSVIEPKPATLGPFLWHLRPLPSPDALDTLVVHVTALRSQQGRKPPIAIAFVLAGQSDDCGRQGIVIPAPDSSVALGRARLSQDPAGPTRGNRLMSWRCSKRCRLERVRWGIVVWSA